MPYRAAILAAIEALRDIEVGSSPSSIRHYIQEHPTRYSDSIVISTSSATCAPISRRSTIIEENSRSKDKYTTWNEVLFQETLKSLVRQGDLILLHGNNYKFSPDYLQKRSEALRSRVDRIRTRSSVLTAPTTVVTDGKEAPKKKGEHAKAKINQSEILTLVDPEKRKKTSEEYMECEQIEGEKMMDTTCTDGSEKKIKEKKKHHVKIIPRKKNILNKKI